MACLFQKVETWSKSVGFFSSQSSDEAYPHFGARNGYIVDIWVWSPFKQSIWNSAYVYIYLLNNEKSYSEMRKRMRSFVRICFRRLRPRDVLNCVSSGQLFDLSTYLKGHLDFVPKNFS